MELHSPVLIAKKLWNYLRVAYFMLMRKGLMISKRKKLVMDLNLMMKRSGKVLLTGKSLLGKNFIMLFHPHHHSSPRSGFGLQEYEFSCSNSPNPVFFATSSTKRHHYYFPCIHPAVAAEEGESCSPPVILLPKIEYYPSPSDQFSTTYDDLAVGERLTPLPSPFSIRVSNYSSEEDGGGHEVDDDAEEFIRRFYQQLRAQSRIALLQYDQEME